MLALAFLALILLSTACAGGQNGMMAPPTQEPRVFREAPEQQSQDLPAPEPTPDWSIPYVPPSRPAQQQPHIAACGTAPLRVQTKPTTETQTLQVGRVTTTINIQRKTFPVKGCTNKDLLASAILNLPIKATGSGYAITTGWHPLVDWSRKSSVSGCSMDGAKLDVAITVYIPEAVTLDGMLPLERDRWSASVLTAVSHEQRHVDIDIQATKRLQTSLAQLPPRPTCSDLDASVRSTVRAAVAEDMRQHEAFHAEERARRGASH